MVSAIPIEPISGGGTTNGASPVPSQHIPTPLLPSSSTAAAVGILFLVLKLKPRFLTDSKTYRLDLSGEKLWLRDSAMKRWIETSFSSPQEYLEYLRTMVKNSVSDKIPVRNDEGKWVLYPIASVKRYLSMLDSASARILRLRRKVDIARLRYLSACRIARRRGSTWRIRGAAKYYDRMVAELNAVKSTVRSLRSWSNDLTKLNFDSDHGFKFNGRTFFFSSGILRGISAEEAYLRFRRKAKKTYAEFRGSVGRIYRELTSKIKSLGWQIVDSSLDSLKSTYNAFRRKLNRLKNEYQRDRNGRNGSWRRYFRKLYENYYREFRDGSEEIYEDYVESINHRAYEELVPESVKLEIKTKERARMKKRKRMMRWRKRRWCSQLRDRARRYHKSLKRSYKRLYDGELYRNLKKQIDEWRGTALKNAKKLRWQRTLEKAEKRFREINHFILDGFYNFREFTNRTVANKIIRKFYGPKKKAEEGVKKQPKRYKQREDLLAYRSAILHSETQSWIDRWNGQKNVVYTPAIVANVNITGTDQSNLMSVLDLNNGIIGVYKPMEQSGIIWNYGEKNLEGYYGNFTGNLDYNNSLLNLSYGNLANLALNYKNKTLEGRYGNHNIEANLNSLNIYSRYNKDFYNQPLNASYSIGLSSGRKTKPNQGGSGNSFSFVSFDMNEGNWNVEANLLPFNFGKKIKKIGKINFELGPGFYFWNRGENFELGTEMEINAGVGIKKFCLGKECIKDTRLTLDFNADMKLLEKQVLPDGRRRLISYPEFNYLTECVEYGVRKDANWAKKTESLNILLNINNPVSYGKILEKTIPLSNNEDKINNPVRSFTTNHPIPSDITGFFINPQNPMKGKMTYWMMDYALHKSVKILPKDERKIELHGGIIVDLDDPDLSDRLQETHVYEYLKDEAGVGAKTNITTRSISFENCSEGQIPCKKVEKKTEKTPEWLRSFEGICDFIGARSNDIYNLLKFFGLDNIL
ncbi:MAG: hypothetical protein DRO89_03600 [Candidatus Altiarchaeales archaeon]|nr:MAG: hypothetical protein DRO89_03600 [Candidatus Altiarchaeales archaeon]